MSKKLSIIAAGLLCAGSAFGMTRGYYFGLQLGESYTNIENAQLETPDDEESSFTKDRRSGFAGRFQYGYMSTPNFGLELNFTKYAESTWNVIFLDVRGPKATFNAYNLNLLARFDMVVSGGLDLYAKPGVALIRTRFKEQSTGFKMNQTKFFLRPEFCGRYNAKLDSNWWAVSFRNASYCPNANLWVSCHGNTPCAET